MKKLIFALLFVAGFSCLAYSQTPVVEPPSWWAGMNHPTLQLVVEADGIEAMRPSVDYPGVRIVSFTPAENPGYLFITLDISAAGPGSFDLKFTGQGRSLSYRYTLAAREKGSAQREGFNSSDVMYLVMPDRFANGDPSNDMVEGMREEPARGKPYGRHGGDIAGISAALPYLSDMGFTAIWLNPVLENDMEQWSYHGYAATDFYRVDRRFGSNEEYRRLSQKAREMGIKMIMDMIFNHCGSFHRWMEKPPFSDWFNNQAGFVGTNHQRTVNQDPHASEADRRGMVDGWFVPTMPDLNQRNPFMAEYLIQNSIWWIEYAGLAGIRMDTYPYPDKEMMAEWNRRVLKEYPDFTIVGEEWSLNPAIVAYWQGGKVNSDGYQGVIPSMMDFPLQSAVAEGLKEKEEWGKGLDRIYQAVANDFLYADPGNLVIFPDNHDMPRFYMQLGMNPQLYKLGITIFLTTRGIPQIFYGSEILMTHTEGDDHGHIRKDFPGGWSGDRINGFTGAGLKQEEAAMQNFFWTMLNWRKDCEIIHNGRLMHFAPRDGVYVYFRYNDNARVMVIINKNEKKVKLDPSRFSEMLLGFTVGRDIISGAEIRVDSPIELKPMEPVVIELKKSVR